MTTTGPFADIDAFLAVPRLGDLRLSPDGTRLVATVSVLDDDKSKRIEALWELDPEGVRAPRRLTWSTKGETSPRWLADGSLLFVSVRGTGAAGARDDEEPAALWMLPAGGGEAVKLLDRAGGVNAVETSPGAPVAIVASPTLPRADDGEDDQRLRKQRKDLKVKAILHESSPVRFWDHDLGPDERRLLAIRLDGPPGDEPPAVRDLTPAPARALDEQSFTVSADGRTVVTGWAVDDEPGFPRPRLVAIDVATGEHRLLADEPEVLYSDPAISPDGGRVACIRIVDSSYDEPPSPTVCVVDLATGERQAVAAAADLWPSRPVWSPDGKTLFFTSDHRGHGPIFRVDLGGDTVTKLTAGGHHTSVSVSPDGRRVYALRDHIDAPPTPVWFDADGIDAEPHVIPAPGALDVAGRLDEIAVTVEDGTTVRAWLALPEQADESSPVPMLLWIHGGPVNSWNAWAWRWNPWLMTARGYAVLLPDPALSTGYGRAMVQRGWGQWGGTPYTDLMAITDETVKRADIDETRTAAMGGSYGGYMANWVAGHTDRFRCIVTHASLWALDQFQGTTDHPAYWAREWGLPDVTPGRYDEWSPHKFLDRITSPMLVIHGDKDYRVPVGEGLRLWWDLQRREVPSKFLYFPDEGHWILAPGNAKVWYETVWAWLAAYVLDQPWERPELV